MDPSTSIELVALAREGDEQALDRLWRENRGWLGTVLVAHGVRDGELEDLLQEVALVVVDKIGTLRDETSFRPWLRRVAINAARMSARKRLRGGTRKVELDAVSVDLEDPGAERDARSSQARFEVERVLGHVRELRIEYREPLLMRSVGGLSQREIAESLGLPETTVETRLARARKMLTESLARAERGVRSMRRESTRRIRVGAISAANPGEPG